MIIYREESSRVLSTGFRMLVTAGRRNQEDETGRAIWVDELWQSLFFVAGVGFMVTAVGFTMSQECDMVTFLTAKK